MEHIDRFNIFESKKRIKQGDRVSYEGEEYFVSKVEVVLSRGFYDTNWHLSSVKVGGKDIVLDSSKGLDKID